MFAILFAAIAVPPGPLPEGIELHQAHAFGATKEVAEFQSSLAYRHKEVMRGEVVGWTTREIYTQWESDCDRRWQCWHRLHVALDRNTAANYCFNDCWPPSDEDILSIQLQCLDELRGLIGAEDYYAGRMPPPIPAYRR